MTVVLILDLERSTSVPLSMVFSSEGPIIMRFSRKMSMLPVYVHDLACASVADGIRFSDSAMNSPSIDDFSSARISRETKISSSV